MSFFEKFKPQDSAGNSGIDRLTDILELILQEIRRINFRLDEITDTEVPQMDFEGENDDY